MAEDQSLATRLREALDDPDPDTAALLDAVADLEADRDELAARNQTLADELQKTNEGLLELTLELQDAEQRYRDLFETAIEGIYKADPELTEYQLVNPAMATILGYDRPSTLTTAVDSIQADVFVDTDRYQTYQAQLSDTGELEDFEYQIHTSDGTVRWVSDNVVAIRDDTGSVTGYRGGMIDITERKRKERDLARFRRATEAAGHAIFLTDTDATITYVNPAFEEITGYSAAEAIGSSPESILQSGEMSDDYYSRMWETISSGDLWEGQIIDQRRSGEFYHAHQTIAPITDADGAVQEFIGIQTDITEQVERERQVNTLDRILRHKLRNELNIVRGHTEQILATVDDSEATASAKRILDSVDALMSTADEGREITSFLATHTYRHAVDVVAITEHLVTAAREANPDVTIDVTAPPTAPVLAPKLLDRAIEELIQNAITHNNSESPWLGVTITRVPDDDMVTVTVEDNGPGIPEIERRFLNTPEEATDLSHGSGLGLWLVYWIVRRSGGELQFQERTPRGSHVTVRLPQPSATTAADETASDHS